MQGFWGWSHRLCCQVFYCINCPSLSWSSFCIWLFRTQVGTRLGLFTPFFWFIFFLLRCRTDPNAVQEQYNALHQTSQVILASHWSILLILVSYWSILGCDLGAGAAGQADDGECLRPCGSWWSRGLQQESQWASSGRYSRHPRWVCCVPR